MLSFSCPRSTPWWPSPLCSLPSACSQLSTPLISCRKDQNLHESCCQLRAPCPVRASSNDASESLFPQSELQSPSFLEFITSERVKVVSMLGLALALCNADRVVMSVAIVPLSLAHSWTQSFSGIVQSSFLWGYLMSPIVGGALVDYYGGKLVMAWGVTLWSMATFLTPWAAETSLWALLAMRILLGAAEGVALPSMNNMISRWFPKTERSRAVGIGMAGFHLGSAIGLLISPIIMARAGIFGPFVIFGLFGFLWVLVWLSATSSSPDRHPQISNYELHYIINNRTTPLPQEKEFGKSRVIPPFKKLLSKMPTWALISANAMHSWGYFVMLSWMPIYFNTIFRVDLRQAAWFSALPWAMMAILGYAAGTISDMLIRSGVTVTYTRKVMQSIGFVGPGIALLGLNVAKDPSVASAWLTAAVGLSSFSHSGFLVNLQEIAPNFAGVLHGMSNTAGTLAAIVGTIGAGFFVEKMGSFQGFLVLTSLLYMACALFWNLFATGEQVNFDNEINT
ncbi:probable anion transporter 3, chloroplastic isoform X1 [Dioscorea cayenensis subsp. rotundata]|uniref:Probable anion transporter 3, chloroplastic isoform X1 n=2 Tax=Dioscorea cayennensis subsp. rotundata TaxID=55577 RepID=A0AB40BLI2_DIOCR|nr:probable anion transporter 3, chloroplastic isoform X1 [Dioscorea cayenensis subsp. rotundata]